ncbi:MAG: aminodeoxychorismate synthase component I [Gammaproteobacteria bacterium]|nr:aminodeoxychorismate synthase component I [Gammaproteobacteria bacterium]
MTHIRHVKYIVDLLALHRANPQRYPFLLQSVAHSDAPGGGQARFDILFAFPGEHIRLDAADTSTDFLQQLDARWRAAAKIIEPSEVASGFPRLPFTGGWFLFLAYELAGQIEPGLSLPMAQDGLPVAYAARIPAAVIVDHAEQQTFLVAESGHANLLDMLNEDMGRISTVDTVSPNIVMAEAEASRYLKDVEIIKNYIVEGDVFQVNLARTWRGLSSNALPSADVYQRLCKNNPAPFAGLALIDGAAIISSSPERLVKVNKRRVETRPIAGTRPRSTQMLGDHALKKELLAHPKERAEHVMLIDLERNDLGRVCVPGSVKVDELMALESYAHVHHIVSNVCGQLRDGVTPGEVIRAVFPGGTITGCPKVRCMEIIAELEGEGRGAYTGAMGYLNHNGDMDLNILIRTITQAGQQLQLRAGGGIVADSDSQKELDETRAKARGMLLALIDNSGC